MNRKASGRVICELQQWMLRLYSDGGRSYVLWYQ